MRRKPSNASIYSQHTKDRGFDSEHTSCSNLEEYKMDEIQAVEDPLMTKCNGHHTLEIPDGDDWSIDAQGFKV